MDALKPNMIQVYYEDASPEVGIFHFGYHDFHEVEPMRLPSVRPRHALHYVFSGEGELYIGKRRYEVHEKQFFLAPKGVSLCYYPKTDSPWSYLWLSYDGAAADALNERISLTAEQPVRDAPPDFDEMPLRLRLGEFAERGSVSYFGVRALFYTIIDALADKKSPATHAPGLVGEAKRTLELNSADPEFSVDSVANALYVSRSYLARLFREQTGMTATQYLISVRLKKAADLFVRTELSAKEIAFRVGYSDDIHFLKSFKKYFGMTTKQYRTKHTAKF